MLKKLAATMVATFALSTGAFAAGEGGSRQRMLISLLTVHLAATIKTSCSAACKSTPRFVLRATV